jgi:hypothetical protein
MIIEIGDEEKVKKFESFIKRSSSSMESNVLEKSNSVKTELHLRSAGLLKIYTTFSNAVVLL